MPPEVISFPSSYNKNWADEAIATVQASVKQAEELKAKGYKEKRKTKTVNTGNGRARQYTEISFVSPDGKEEIPLVNNTSAVETSIRDAQKYQTEDMSQTIFNDLMLGTGFERPLLNFASKKLVTPIRSLYRANKVARNLNRATKAWDGTVGLEYFNAPDKWYRITSSPEIYGIQQQGMNVTTRDLADFPTSINSFRELVINKGLVPGTGQNEGYWFWPQKLRDAARNKKIAESVGETKRKLFSLDSEPWLFRKTGSAHGNRTQAAFNTLWNGSTSTTDEFPIYVLEGNPLANLTIPYGKQRSRFNYVPVNQVPYGGRVGFKTGEMPMEGLRAFRQLSNGRYQYEGLVLPNKTISLTPVNIK